MVNDQEGKARVVLASVCLAALVLPIDFSGVAIAGPAIGRELAGGPVALDWVINAFMLSFGSTLLVMGALADSHGRRRVFLSGLVGFVAVSVALCFSPSLLVLDVGRLVQGVAAAATLAGGTAALAQEFEGQARARAMSLLGTTFGCGLAFGPTIAGVSNGLETGPSIGAQSGPPLGRFVPVIHRRGSRAAECPSRG